MSPGMRGVLKDLRTEYAVITICFVFWAGSIAYRTGFFVALKDDAPRLTSIIVTSMAMFVAGMLTERVLFRRGVREALSRGDDPLAGMMEDTGGEEDPDA